MTQRDLGLGLLVAVVATTAFVAGMGLVVSRQFDSSGHVRLDATPISSPNAAVTAEGVPVLCYHYLRDKSDPLRLLRVFGYVVLSLPLLNDSELWTISAGEFERQMEFLKSRDYHTITLDELHEWQAGRRELPRNPIVITFDDGDESVYNLALPILARMGFRATLFVVTARVGTKWDEVRCLDWARLRELEDSGVFRIESHTDDMHFKVNAEGATRPVFVAASEHGYQIEGRGGWENAVRADMQQSRAAIERHIGRSPMFLAWPYGSATPDLDRLATDVGFLRTCSLRARSNVRPSTSSAGMGVGVPIEIARFTITARTSLRVFRSILEGTYRPSA